MNLNELYTQIITENSRSKQNRHPVEGATHSLEGVNPIGLYFDMIKGKITPEQLDDLEDVAALQGIAHVPARVKCAVLAWHTLEEALDGEGKI